MTCPRCHTQSDDAFSLCPACGLQVLRSVSGVMKTSTIMVAVGNEHGFYRSVREVPEPLRTQLIASTSSVNSGTILIADRAGREQLTQIIGHHERGSDEDVLVEDELAEAAPVLPAMDEGPESRKWLGLSWMVWTGLILACVIALLIAAVSGARW